MCVCGKKMKWARAGAAPAEVNAKVRRASFANIANKMHKMKKSDRGLGNCRCTWKRWADGRLGVANYVGGAEVVTS